MLKADEYDAWREEYDVEIVGTVDECKLKLSDVEDEEIKNKINCYWYTISYGRHT